VGPVENAAADRWLGRPWLSRAVRIIVYGVPFACSILGALALSNLIPMAHSWPVAVARLIVIAIGSTIVLYGADRLTRRLLPLAALLSLTLVFPDEAPSRFKIAMRSGGTVHLRRRLEEYRRIGAHEPALAAKRLLELVADLSVHDRLTRGHSERVRAYSQMIGEELGLSVDEIDKLRWAALLHDIGKLEIPFEILNKPDTLTDDEFETIRRHPGIGAKLAAPLAGWLGPSVRAVGEHHERWDGRGYPNGLRGADISLAARIVAVADAFDVMTSLRSYKKPGTPAEARAELARCAGTQFDANVVRAFLSISLGKLRLAMGPLSWLTQLAFFPTGLVGATAAAPTLMAAAGLTAAALGNAAIPGTDFSRAPRDSAVVAVVELADQRDDSSVVVSTTEPTSSITTIPEGTALGSAESPNRSSGSTVPVTTSRPTPATSTIPPAQRADVDGNIPDETVPVIPTPTPTPNPVTPAPRSPSSPTPSASTSPPRSPGPTSPPATVSTPTTVSPTTPPALPGTTYLLGSSAVGDVASQSVLPLVARAPLNTGPLPNLDTDLDNRPGRVLRKNPDLALPKTDKIQRFRLDPTATLRLYGPATLVLYAAARDFRDDRVQAGAMLVDCDAIGLCNMFATATASFAPTDKGFTPITFDFGSQSRTLPGSHNLELWIVVNSGSERDMWMAYDTIAYESALTITT
jgi:hypothetical protein